MVKKIERLEDMSPRGRLRLTRQDGDIIVAVQSDKDGLLQPGDSVEFCSIGIGGGRSRHTYAALLALMEAMERDNAEEPCRAP